MFQVTTYKEDLYDHEALIIANGILNLNDECISNQTSCTIFGCYRISPARQSAEVFNFIPTSCYPSKYKGLGANTQSTKHFLSTA